MRKIIAICSLSAMLLTACGADEKVDTENIKNITIEVLNEDGQSIKEISLSDEDKSDIKKMLSESHVYTDNGFVFAEGMYRIVLEYENENMRLYPYCGSGGKLRVGETGNKYTDVVDDDIDELKEIINGYFEIKGGIYDWDSIGETATFIKAMQ